MATHRPTSDPTTASWQRHGYSVYFPAHQDSPVGPFLREERDRARAVGLVTSVLESGCDPEVWRGASEVRRFLLSRELVAA